MLKKIKFLLLSLFLLIFAGCNVAFPQSNLDSYGNLNVSIIKPTFENEAVVGIDYSHYEIHEGDHYYSKGYFTQSASSSNIIYLLTGNRTVHLLTEFWSIDGAFNVTFRDNCTVSSNGTTLKQFNSNRNYNDHNSMSIFLNPTTTSNGTILSANYVGQGNKLGGDIRSESEIVLSKNSCYMFRFTNQITTSNILNYNFGWYDEE